MRGELEVKVQDKTWQFDYPHPVNMNLRGSIFLVLDKNVFTEACIHIDIDEPDLQMEGDVYFDREIGRCWISPKRKIWAMEQELSGELLVNGKEISFDGGKGYLESFERHEKSQRQNITELYSQCNCFQEKPLRIVCGGRRRNCFAVIDQDGYRVKLAGWKGAKIEYVTQDAFRMVQGKYVLEGWRAEGERDTVRYKLTHRGDILLDEISRRAVYQCSHKLWESGRKTDSFPRKEKGPHRVPR